jgi:hypothetical protein
MKKKQRVRMLTGFAGALLFAFGAASAGAQEPAEDARPKPAARGFPPLGEDDGNQPDRDALQPDTRPLTGVQNATLGRIVSEHSYWIPGIQYGNTIQNNGAGSQGQSSWSITNYLSGNASLLEDWKSAQLSLNYSGGGTFSTNSAQGNGYFHQFGLVQAFEWSRWQLQFLDQFSYLPESQFGFGGGSSLGIPGIGGSLGPPLPGVGGSFTPNDTIFTARGPRYNNSFTTQVAYQLSPRSSINVAGSYGILRYIDPGNIESNDVIANAGYNYQLTKKDSIGLSYLFSRFSYIGNPQAIDDQVISLAYGRKITGRMALQGYGGPEITTFAIPLGNETRRISGSGGATLTYQFSKSGLDLSYSHAVSGGSGVFAGASTDQIQTGLGRNFGRALQAHVNFGFARNKGIGGAQTQAAGQSFNSWFVGGGLNRSLGPDASFSLGYTARIQSTGVSPCPAGGCSSSSTQHQIGMTLQWHTRPLLLR